MSKELRIADITETLAPYTEQFSRAEIHILEAILLNKMRWGIEIRLANSASNLADKLSSNAAEHFGAFGTALKTLNIRTHEQIRETALMIGISDQRYEELWSFIYENETSF